MSKLDQSTARFTKFLHKILTHQSIFSLIITVFISCYLFFSPLITLQSQWWQNPPSNSSGLLLELVLLVCWVGRILFQSLTNMKRSWEEEAHSSSGYLALDRRELAYLQLEKVFNCMFLVMWYPSRLMWTNLVCTMCLSLSLFPGPLLMTM